MRALLAMALCLVSLLPGAQTARAHALQPGYLELKLIGDDIWRVFWRKPAVGGRPMRIDARLPANCDRRLPPEAAFDGTAWVARWIAICRGGLAGGAITIPGLDVTRTDVLVRFELSPGEGEARRLTPDEPAFVVPETPSAVNVLRSYFGLGVEHILRGADHLLFVFALLLLIRRRWRLVGAVTAFTVAHSLTLAAAVLGWFVIPAPPVEAVVALSIMVLAAELVQRDGTQGRLSERYPWVASFAFGLLHGLGFARALLDLGLPKGNVPLALLAFNVGVEAGQLMFIAVVIGAAVLLRRLSPAMLDAGTRPGGAGATGVGYAIGGVSAYWFVSRVAVF